MGLYDYVKVHKKWLDIPKNSFVRECYEEEDYFTGFQTKDTSEQYMFTYIINEKGELIQEDTHIWNDNIKTVLGIGGFERKEINEHIKDFNGELNIYSSLWGSGKPGSGSWPSPIYESLGECDIVFVFVDGKIHKIKSFKLTEPIKKSQETIEKERKEKEAKEKAKLTKSPKEWADLIIDVKK